MTTLARSAAVSLLFFHAASLGCGSDGGTSSDEGQLVGCKGAKRDANGACRAPDGRFAKESCCASVPAVDLRCDVVIANQEVSELEEGWGALYDIDSEGFSQADEDAENIDVQTESGGLTMSLGHHSWDPADGDRIESVPGDGFQQYVLHPASGGEVYTVRVFENQLGVVLYQESAKAEAGRLGTLDCRGVLDADPVEPDVTKMDSCNVVWVDDSINGKTLEEGLGSIYDIDDEGFPQADGDSTSVDLVATEGEREVDLGQHSFSEADGDTIEIEDTDEFVTYVVRPTGNDEVFSVRIFRNANDAEIPGIGVILYQESADADVEQLAVIDCRGIDVPDER